jgi:hypothetical protein
MRNQLAHISRVLRSELNLSPPRKPDNTRKVIRITLMRHQTQHWSMSQIGLRLARTLLNRTVLLGLANPNRDSVIFAKIR